MHLTVETRDGAASITFSLDLGHRTLVEAPEAGHGPSLAHQLAAALGDEDWTHLRGVWMDLREDTLCRADLDTLAPRMPPDLGRSGSLLGYGELIPWSPGLRFLHQEHPWIALDDYCVKPACTCTDTHLDFVPLAEGPWDCEWEIRAASAGGFPGVWLDCRSLRPGEARESREAALPRIPALLEALKADWPDLVATLQARRSRLRRLVRSSLRMGTFVPPRAREAKVVRNEPCPCGSGRKYKRCCGTSEPAPLDPDAASKVPSPGASFAREGQVTRPSQVPDFRFSPRR